MGNKNINLKTSRGTTLSTVGVDIGDWVYEKKVRNQSIHGPVIFRTWDFGGQKEYVLLKKNNKSIPPKIPNLTSTAYFIFNTSKIIIGFDLNHDLN